MKYAHSLKTKRSCRCAWNSADHHVATEYITVNLTPDNPHHSAEMAQAMINANRAA